jgi:N6-adenosine-specific RNA methylase IME4
VSKKLSRRVEIQPIVIGSYTLTSTELIVKGRPSYEEHLGAGDFIQRAVKASGFWLADWLRYGESRSDWRERIDQALEHTGLSEKTLKNIRAVGSIATKTRRAGVEFSHHAAVASLEPGEQGEWLERAETEGWSTVELRQEIRAAKRTRVIEGQAILEGLYPVIYADPPWAYRDNRPTEDGSLGKAERHFSGMSIEELCKLPIAAHATPNAVLWMWVTAPLLYDNPGPREVIEAWGFKAKAGYVWDKVLGNPGSYSHVVHEHLIIATRGSYLPDAPTPQPKSIFTERRSPVHSAKPDIARQIITKLYTRGPYLELFGREKVPGWTVFGNDARLWSADAEEQSA